MSTPRTTRGGARPGAGRPALPESASAVAIAVRVRPAVAAKFSAHCTARGLSQAKAFSAMVARLR